jgi:hypothetical protein
MKTGDNTIHKPKIVDDFNAAKTSYERLQILEMHNGKKCSRCGKEFFRNDYPDDGVYYVAFVTHILRKHYLTEEERNKLYANISEKTCDDMQRSEVKKKQYVK